MLRFFIITFFFWVTLVFASFVLNKVSTPPLETSENRFNMQAEEPVDTESWRETIDSIEDYKPRKTKAEIAAERRRLAKLAAKKQRKLGDATLVGTVLEKNGKALLLVPGKPEPIEMTIGGVWLKPWRLEAIYSDYVVWQNTDTQKRQQQALFK